MCRGADWTDYKDKFTRLTCHRRFGEDKTWGRGGGYSLQFIGHNILRFKVTGKKTPLIILIDVQL